jgi:hypothetical protein
MNPILRKLKENWILKVDRKYIWNQLLKCVQTYFLGFGFRKINEIDM